MSLAEKSLAILAAWCVLALIVGLLLGRHFGRMGADEAFDTLPEGVADPELWERLNLAMWTLEMELERRRGEM